MLCRYLVACALLAAAFATSVEQCPGKSIPDLAESAQLTPCKKPPCRLKKGTNTHVKLSFTPDHEIKDLRNHVQAQVFGVPLPFIGVDGVSVCDKVFLEDGTKAGCPLQAGTKYVYKDSFPVLSIYPSISTRIHWALQEDENDITCFEVDARIA